MKRSGGVSYARHEVDSEDEDNDRVDIVRELQSVQLISGKQRENAVEAGDFVYEERKGDELGGGAEGDEVEERLFQR